MKLLSILFILLSLNLNNYSPETIIPRPAEITPGKGQTSVAGLPMQVDMKLGADAAELVVAFASKLSTACGKVSSVNTEMFFEDKEFKGFSFEYDEQMSTEQYLLQIDRKGVKVKAATSEAVLWAIRSIEQMLPVQIYTGEVCPKAKWSLYRCTISDKPRFSYRGVLLDVARHFFTVDEVKKVINLMSIYKMNHLHWHLTDDQGWRIESKKYPNLTKVGAWRRGTMIGRDFNSCDNVRYGGYYTQEQIRDVVNYAAQRGIEIIPEIDLPGHMMGALATYPQLGCTGGPYEVWTKWGISRDVLCPGKEIVFEFLNNVLGEVADLFPCEYFHIGGDECPVTRWETCPDCQNRIKELGLKGKDGVSAERMLQRYVVERVKTFLEQEKGKKVVCWDEVLKTSPDKNTTIMVWTGTDNIEKACQAKYNVIMTPKWYCYTDYIQAEEGEPLGQPRVISLEKLYRFEPSDFYRPGCADRIMGMQINHWGEYFVTPEHMEYMLLPRLFAAAEVAWSPVGSKDWERFRSSLAAHQIPIIKALGFNYRPLD